MPIGYDTFFCRCGVSVTLAWIVFASGWASLATDFDLTLRGYWPSYGRAHAKAVAIADGYVYVAAGTAGLIVIDFSDPANPQRVGELDTGGDARGVAVSGNYAYVADGPEGLQVILIADPANPSGAA